MLLEIFFGHRFKKLGKAYFDPISHLKFRDPVKYLLHCLTMKGQIKVFCAKNHPDQPLWSSVPVYGTQTSKGP